MGRVRADVHQVGDTVSAFALGIAFKQLANLEKQHDKDCLGKLCLGPWQKTDAECPYGRNRHEEMFVERITVKQTLDSLVEGVVPDEQIRDQIDQQQLPGGQIVSMFDNDGCDEQQDGDGDERQLSL